jgi:putative membrane protein
MKTMAIRTGLFLAGLLVPWAAQAQEYNERAHMWGDGWGWGQMIFGGAMMIAFWGVIILLIVLAVRWLGSVGHGSSSGSSGKRAADILRERFARGEIDKTEFEERRRALGDE